MKNKVIDLFLDVDMRLSHTGLSKLAHTKKINVRELGEGQHVLFLNRKRNRLKCYSRSNIVTYCAQDERRPFDITTLATVSGAFQSDGSFNYDAALKKRLEKRLGLRRDHPIT